MKVPGDVGVDQQCGRLVCSCVHVGIPSLLPRPLRNRGRRYAQLPGCVPCPSGKAATVEVGVVVAPVHQQRSPRARCGISPGQCSSYYRVQRLM